LFDTRGDFVEAGMRRQGVFCELALTEGTRR
jgi:hypothetical protein